MMGYYAVPKNHVTKNANMEKNILYTAKWKKQATDLQYENIVEKCVVVCVYT